MGPVVKTIGIFVVIGLLMSIFLSDILRMLDPSQPVNDLQYKVETDFKEANDLRSKQLVTPAAQQFNSAVASGNNPTSAQKQSYFMAVWQTSHDDQQRQGVQAKMFRGDVKDLEPCLGETTLEMTWEQHGDKKTLRNMPGFGCWSGDVAVPVDAGAYQPKFSVEGYILFADGALFEVGPAKFVNFGSRRGIFRFMAKGPTPGQATITFSREAKYVRK